VQRGKCDSLKGLFKGNLTSGQEGALTGLIQEAAYKERKRVKETKSKINLHEYNI
jgi:hypothetical protein